MPQVPTHIHGWAATEKGGALKPIEKKLEPLTSTECLIKVHSCGICHSDIHLIDNDWKTSSYPLVPGHEIVGEVQAVGSDVKHLKPGMIVGVGWQRNSCQVCADCISARDNLCTQSKATCVNHWGGYADYHVTDSKYAFEMPARLLGPEAAPLLCGGTTVFSPLAEVGSLSKRKPVQVGIVALGGLGHLAVKIAVAMGYEVSLFSSSPSKEVEAKKMGVARYVNSTSAQAIADVGPRFDLLLVTANVDLPWESYIGTIRTDGTLCFVGIPPSPLSLPIFHLMSKQRKITASSIGSRACVQQMLEFTALHKIHADIEVFKMGQVNEALEKVRTNKVRYRAVIVP
jgi:alcohol/geraniol dehydrogenase (NADP+)